MSNARNIARLNASSSGILSSKNVDATSLPPGSVVGSLGYTPVNKAGDIIEGSLRIRHANGGEWAMLGTVIGGNTYLHIKTSLHRDSFKMVGFKVSSFYSYSAWGEGTFGCYTYGSNTTTQPYGVVAHNQGNHAVASTMYYSSDNYVVLSCYWPTSYVGLQVEYIATGAGYGGQTGITILSYTSTASQTGAY